MSYLKNIANLVILWLAAEAPIIPISANYVRDVDDSLFKAHVTGGPFRTCIIDILVVLYWSQLLPSLMVNNIPETIVVDLWQT